MNKKNKKQPSKPKATQRRQAEESSVETLLKAIMKAGDIAMNDTKASLMKKQDQK